MRCFSLSLLLVMTNLVSLPVFALDTGPPVLPAQIEEEDPDDKDEDKSFESISPVPEEKRRPKNVSGSSAPAGVTAQAGSVARSKELQAKPPWAGSSVRWGNSARAVNLRRDALLTYNPYTVMSFSLKPQYRFPMVVVGANVSLATQLTQADDNRPTSFADPQLTVRPASAYEIPKTGIKVSGSGGLALGLSPYSRAAGQSFSATARASLSRALEFRGVKGGVNFGAGWTGYQTSTQQGTTARAVGPACVQGLSAFVEMPGDCAGFFVHDGSPNNKYKTSLSLGANVKALPWLAFSLGGGLTAIEVYAMAVDDPLISYRRVDEPVTTRYFQAFSLGASLGPWSGFGASMAYATAGPQLDPGATPYPLLYNRFTMLSLELSYQL